MVSANFSVELPLLECVGVDDREGSGVGVTEPERLSELVPDKSTSDVDCGVAGLDLDLTLAFSVSYRRCGSFPKGDEGLKKMFDFVGLSSFALLPSNTSATWGLLGEIGEGFK